MDNEQLSKRVMTAKVYGRNVRGRPRIGWMDGVKKALNDRGMDVREANDRARNRNEWRAKLTHHRRVWPLPSSYHASLVVGATGEMAF